MNPMPYRHSFLLRCFVVASLWWLSSTGGLSAQNAVSPVEDDFYPLTRFTIPEGIVLEAGAMEPLPDGTLALRMTDDGSMFVGGTNRGWGSRGTKPFSLERLNWSGKVPFEIHEMRARPDGFELTFTEPINAEIAGKPETWNLQTCCYVFQSSYGSPEVDQTTPKVTEVSVSEDRYSVRLKIDGLQRGHIHELHADA